MSLLQYLLETLFQFSSLLTLNCTSSSVVLLYLYTINSCCLLLILENNSFLESLNEFYILPRFQDLIKNQEHYCVTRESLSARIFHICLKYLFACVLKNTFPEYFCQQLTSSGFSFMTSDKDGEKWSRMWRMMKGRRCLRRQIKTINGSNTFLSGRSNQGDVISGTFVILSLFLEEVHRVHL